MNYILRFCAFDTEVTCFTLGACRAAESSLMAMPHYSSTHLSVCSSPRSCSIRTTRISFSHKLITLRELTLSQWCLRNSEKSLMSRNAGHLACSHNFRKRMHELLAVGVYSTHRPRLFVRFPFWSVYYASPISSRLQRASRTHPDVRRLC